MKVKIRNRSQAPQGFYEVQPEPEAGGPIYVDGAPATYIRPGETKVFDLEGVQLDHAKLLAKTGHIVLADEAGKQLVAEQLFPDDEPAAAVAAGPQDQYSAMSDEALRSFITTRDGRAPHPMTGREKLLAKARETKAESLAEDEGEAGAGQGAEEAV